MRRVSQDLRPSLLFGEKKKANTKKSCRPYFSLLNKAASRQWPKQNWPPAIKKWALLISIKVESFKIKALPRFFFLFKGEKDFFFLNTPWS